MSIVQEAWDMLKRIVEEYDDKNIIKINAYVSPEEGDYILEGLPSGNKSDIYDDQTIEDWYDFASTVEGIINNFCKVINISMSNNEDSLSEYIDFYFIDEEGNTKDYLVDLRLSDHPVTKTAQQVRKHKLAKLNQQYVLKSVTVNDKTFNSYSEAIEYIRKISSKEFFNNK